MSRTRGTWNSAGVWVAGVALAAVLGLTGYSLLSGDEAGSGTPAASTPAPGAAGQATPSPVTTYAPPKDWSEPQRWAVLPRGQNTDIHGSKVGYPHTKEGAIAMLLEGNKTSIGDGRTGRTEQLRVYHSYFAKSDQSDDRKRLIEQQGKGVDDRLAQQAGVSPGSPLPAGSYQRVTPIGFKIVTQSNDEVAVWVLSNATSRFGETAKEGGAYSRTLVAAQWVDNDWKLTVEAGVRAFKEVKGKEQPQIVAPGDAQFNAAGWTALREAS
ncbi:hypothetical protein [Streptomyces sp. Isolate_45]|uniref:hypothetical protein n=1 Tax=Streptomyces sp. Isolate_45 TaxID=2950111 RepID=UPI002481C29D|nr:hypothetical protein [Streptomyces sp. Isolate_45]MDA5279883.1 hypothetical protein [Streptomyces sp. Isolate_45]